jgi:prepilin-type processing-associated H-X9-DG protein
MIFDRLTWIGFMIVAAGWALLLSAPALNEAAAHLSGRAPEAAPLVNVPAIAQSAILSGFGVSIIGALQTGFGVLDRFFAAVLARSGQARAQTSPSSAAYPAAQSPAPAANYRAAPPAAPAARAIARQQPAQPRKILERGWVKDRAYVLFVDGSVEVETMLGRRIFPSLQEAQEFIA